MKTSSAHLAVAAIVASAFSITCRQAKKPAQKAPANAPAFSFASKTVSLPVSVRLFKGGVEAQVANKYCLLCHSAGMLSIQPPFDCKTWVAEINKMRAGFGCPLPEGDVAKLADFLYMESQRGWRLVSNGPRSSAGQGPRLPE